MHAARDRGLRPLCAANSPRAREAVETGGPSIQDSSTSRSSDPSGHVSIGTMHLAKGLEFRAVA